MQKPSVNISDLGAIGFALAGFTFWVFTDTTIKFIGQYGLRSYFDRTDDATLRAQLAGEVIEPVERDSHHRRRLLHPSRINRLKPLHCQAQRYSFLAGQTPDRPDSPSKSNPRSGVTDQMDGSASPAG
jgi:hypothetical protein